MKLTAKKTPVKKNIKLNGGEIGLLVVVLEKIKKELIKTKIEIKQLKTPKTLFFLIKLKFSNFGLYIYLKNRNEKATKKTCSKV